MIFGQHFLIKQNAKSVGCLRYLVLSNYEGLNLNLRQASQNYCKSPRRSPKKIKVFRGTTTKTDLVSDSVKVDFSVIRDETAPLRLLNNRKCLFL